jgi:hypothetical protein
VIYIVCKPMDIRISDGFRFEATFMPMDIFMGRARWGWWIWFGSGFVISVQTRSIVILIRCWLLLHALPGLARKMRGKGEIYRKWFKYVIRCDVTRICFSKTLITHIAETSNGAWASWRLVFLKKLKVTLASVNKIETKNLDVDHYEIY